MPNTSEVYTPKPIAEIASKLDLESDEFSSYGPLMGKIRTQVLDRLADKPDGKLILVTAISPTSAGKARRRLLLVWRRRFRHGIERPLMYA